ncbi:hypothetical protein D5994_25410, partial [Vibrio parahaemolyticus]|nr:hypothetical protein [Vibrio parahaemolyticus]
QAQNVTKPIQLLAAWLVGLIAINGSFLGAANVISTPTWAAGLLVIASVFNVPLFLGLIFFLQTKFRAELQEDSFYAKHLDKVTGAMQTSDTSIKAEVKADVQKIQKENAENYEAIQKELRAVMNSLNGIAYSSGNSELEQKVVEAQQRVAKLESNNKKFSIKLALNKVLDQFNAISHELTASGYIIADVFGSDKLNSKAISYIDGVDKVLLLDIVNTLKPFGFDRIDYDPEDKGFDRDAKVYIGSYIDDFPEARRSVLISHEVMDILEDDTKSLRDLNNFIRDQQA